MQLLRVSSLRNVPDNVIEITISLTPMTCIQLKISVQKPGSELLKTVTVDHLFQKFPAFYIT